MLSQKSIDLYRSMSLGEKLALTLSACRRHEPCLLIGTPDEVDRKFQLIQRDNDLRNANLLAAFTRTGP